MTKYQLPDAEYHGESMGSPIYAYTEAQLLEAYQQGQRDMREAAAGFLSMSRDTFAANFGKSVDADWIYDDLNELLKEELK